MVTDSVELCKVLDVTVVVLYSISKKQLDKQQHSVTPTYHYMIASALTQWPPQCEECSSIRGTIPQSSCVQQIC